VNEINYSEVSSLEAAFIIGLAVGTVWAAFIGRLADAGFLFVLTVVNILLFEYTVNAESYPISEKTIWYGSAVVLVLVFSGPFLL
jgi:hypothetical protein